MTRQLKCECGECSTCKRRERGRAYRARNRSAYNAYMRAFYAKNASSVRERVKRYRTSNIDVVRALDRARGRRDASHVKESARRKVKTALANGSLTKMPCEICGTRDKVQAHHDDYSKPLDVRWLCTTHHGEQHRRIV